MQKLSSTNSEKGFITIKNPTPKVVSEPVYNPIKSMDILQNNTSSILQDTNSDTKKIIDTQTPTAALQPASSENKGNKKYLYIGAGVLVLIVLVVVFIKLKK